MKRVWVPHLSFEKDLTWILLPSILFLPPTATDAKDGYDCWIAVGWVRWWFTIGFSLRRKLGSQEVRI